MARVYADLIRKGYKTIDDVPDRLKAAVQEILKTYSDRAGQNNDTGAIHRTDDRYAN